MSAIANASPSCVRLRIGVSGHRKPPKLPPESWPLVRAAVDRVFAVIADIARRAAAELRSNDFPLAVPDITVISSLAEGADRIVAEAGLAAGFGLEVPLPFKPTEYAHDFVAGASRAQFERLLARASNVFELDGSAEQRPRAYEVAGLVMLANSDLLIAIWDGEAAVGTGGTAQIVSRAIAEGLLVVWIEPTDPDAMKISWAPADSSAPDQENFRLADVGMLARAIHELLALPKHQAKLSP